jgi:hypothetical protein
MKRLLTAFVALIALSTFSVRAQLPPALEVFQSLATINNDQAAQSVAAPMLMIRTAVVTGPSLQLRLVDVADEPIVAAADAFPGSSAGGAASVSVVCFTGQALELTALGMAAGQTMLIQSSPDLLNWQDCPAPGFSLTLTADTPTANVIPPGPRMFFRGRMGQ